MFHSTPRFQAYIIAYMNTSNFISYGQLHSRFSVCILFVMTMMLNGCQTTTEADKAFDDTQNKTQLKNEHEGLYQPLIPGEVEYKITEGEGEGDVVKYVYKKHKSKPNVMVVDTANKRMKHLSFDKDGVLVMLGAIDLKHNAYSKYDPPLPVLKPDMKKGDKLETEAKILIVNKNDEEQVLDRGTCTQTITHQGMEKITTPAGTFECIKLEVKYTAKLGTASVEKTSVEHYAKGVGLVREYTDEKVAAFLFGWNTKRTVKLNKKPAY